MDHRTQQLGDRCPGFSLRVICKQFDWQIDTATQICESLMSVLSCVEELKLDFDGEAIPTEWQNGAIDDAAWHELLRSFVGVITLRVCRALVFGLSCALQSDNVGLDPELLPALQELSPDIAEWDTDRSFSAFIDARQVAGRPVRLRLLTVPFSTPLSRWRLPPTSALKYCKMLKEASMRWASWEPPRPRRVLIQPSLEVPLEYDPPASGAAPPVRVERNPPPHIDCSARSVGIRPPPPKYIASRLRPSRRGAGSTSWR